MFTVSAKVDYSLVILVELTKVWPKSYLALSDIAKTRQVSKKFLSQVAIPLHQAGLVQSREGKLGGYKLALPPKEISLRSVVEAVDGPLKLVRCMTANKTCPAQAKCSSQPIWLNLKQEIYQLLANKTLADIVLTK